MDQKENLPVIFPPDKAIIVSQPSYTTVIEEIIKPQMIDHNPKKPTEDPEKSNT